MSRLAAVLLLALLGVAACGEESNEQPSAVPEDMAGLYYAPPSQHLRLSIERARKGWAAEKVADEEKERRAKEFEPWVHTTWVMLDLRTSGRFTFIVAQEVPARAVGEVLANLETSSGSWRMEAGRLVFVMDGQSGQQEELTVANGTIEYPYLGLTLALRRDNPQTPPRERSK